MNRLPHPAHKYFKYDQHSDTSTCKFCKAALKKKHANNLHRHLLHKHKEIADQLDNEIEQFRNLRSEIRTKTDYLLLEFDKNKVIKTFVEQLESVNGRPLSIFEGSRFPWLMKPVKRADTENSGEISYAINRNDIKTNSDIKVQKIKSVIEEIRGKFISLQIAISNTLELEGYVLGIRYSPHFFFLLTLSFCSINFLILS